MKKQAYIHVQRYGKGVKHVYVDEHGNIIKKTVPYKQKIWSAKNNNDPVEWYDIHGKPLICNEIDEKLSDYIEKNENVGGFDYCGDIDVKYQFIAEEYKDGVDLDFDLIPKMFFDIEVFSGGVFPDPWEASQEITAIGFYLTSNKKKYVYGLKDYTGNDSSINYRKFKDETEMLSHFLSMWNMGVACIIGFNSNDFDLPYIINRANNLGIDIEKKLPMGSYYEKSDKFSKSYCIPGLVRYDWMNLVKKYDLKKMERYSLDFVAKQYLGKEEGKLDYLSEFKSLHELYEKDFNKFVDYNMKDVMLLVEMEEIKKYVDLSLEISYRCCALPEDVMSSMKVWDCYLYSKLINKNIVVPKNSKRSTKTEEKYIGAYVSEPERGLKDWVAVFDVNSLYPNILISLNASSITKIQEKNITDDRLLYIKKNISVESLLLDNIDLNVLKEFNYSVSANGIFYDIKNRDIICEVLKNMFTERMNFKSLSKNEMDESKKTNYELKVSFYKVMMNSFYGCAGNQHFRWYDKDVATSVTTTGQFIIRKIAKDLDSMINRIVGDK